MNIIKNLLKVTVQIKRKYQTHHKTEQPNEDSRHAPSRIPSVGMKVRYRETEFCIDFESAIWCCHVNTRRLEREFSWEDELAMIKSTFIWSVLWSFYNVVPRKDKQLD